MNNKYVQISGKSNGYNLDGSQALYGPSAPSDLRGTPIINFDVSGSGVEFGDGVVLTAAHLFDGVAIGSLGPVGFKSFSSSVEGQTASSPVYLEIWNAQNAFAGIQTGDPMPDLAYVKTGLSIAPSDLSPVMVFADQNAESRELSSDGAIQAYGAKSQGETEGRFSSIVTPGIFATTNITQSGDSGGPAYVTKAGVSYVVGIDSYGSADAQQPDSKFSYLTTADYESLSDALSSNSFTAMPPDLIVGADNNEVIRGSKRKADIITTGDDDVILAASGGGLVNTGAGEDDTIVLPTAAGNADPGTTVVMSPGDKTIVGGGPNDKLVVPLDRLWTKAGGSPSSNLSDASATVQLMGGLYNGGFETNGFSSGGWETSDSIAGQSGSTDPLSWQDADYNLLTGYNLVDGNLQIRVSASDPSQAGDPVVWQSRVTIVNYHEGDFGLTFKPFSDPGPIDYSNLDAWYQKSYQARLSDELSLTAMPVASSDIDDDPSSVWSDNRVLGFKAVDQTKLATALALVGATDDTATGSIPPSPSPDQTIAQDDATATLNGGATATVTGNRDTVTASGAGGTIHFGGTGESATISDGTVDFWDGAGGTVTGDRNTVTLDNAATAMVSGSGNVADLQGVGGQLSIAGSTVNVFQGGSGTVTGDGNTLSIYAANATVTATGANDAATLYDDGGTLTMVGPGAAVAVGATGETLAASGASVELWDGAAATITGDGNTVTLDDGATATVSGSGNVADLQGTGGQLSIAGSTVNVFQGGSGTVTGDGDALSIYASTVTADGADDSATLYDNGGTLTMVESGATVAVGGTGETLAASVASVQLWNGAGATVTGDRNTVTLDDDATATVSGSGNVADLQGTGGQLSIAGSTVNVFDGGSGTVTGDGDALSIYAGATVTAAGDDDTATLYGKGSSLTASGARVTVTVASTDETVVVSAAQVDLWNDAGVTVQGTGDTLVLNDDDTASVSGTNATATIQGIADRLTADGAQVGIVDGSSATVSGDGNRLTLFGGATLAASGSNDTFVFSPTPGNVLLTGYDATDTLQFSSSQFSDWQSLLGHASQNGADTVIQTDATHSVTLAGITLATLDRNHVQFA